MASALDLVVDQRLQYWGALILSASADAGATLLLSEDMQDGFVWRDLRKGTGGRESLADLGATILSVIHGNHK